MDTSAAPFIKVNTRLGELTLKSYPVVGAPIEISAQAHVLKRGRKVLCVPRGGVLIPRRYGPDKVLSVMQVYANIFDAIRSRRGVDAYYGRHDRGKLFRQQELVVILRRDALACPEAEAAGRLGELARRLQHDVYSTGRLLSRLDIWANSLLLSLGDDAEVLQSMRRLLDAFRNGKQIDLTRLRDLSSGLRLAPFIDIDDHVLAFVGTESKRLSFLRASEDKRVAADELIEEIDGYLLRIVFERLHCEMKEVERAIVDDVDRERKSDDGQFHVRLINGILPSLYVVRSRILHKPQKKLLGEIADTLIETRRAIANTGLTSNAVTLFRTARGLMKTLGEQL